MYLHYYFYVLSDFLRNFVSHVDHGERNTSGDNVVFLPADSRDGMVVDNRFHVPVYEQPGFGRKGNQGFSIQGDYSRRFSPICMEV